MKLAVLHGGIPSLGHSGSTIAAWTIVEQLVNAGHEVRVIALPAPELYDDTVPARFAALERLTGDLRVIEIPPAREARHGRWRRRAGFARTLARPRDDELFPAIRAQAAVADALKGIDAGIAFAFEAAAATAGVETPLLAVLSHPPGVPRRLRLRYAPGVRTGWSPASLSARASELSYLAYADRRAAAILRTFPRVGVFSEHHAEWARRRGVNAFYAHYPMPDLAGPDWRQRRAAAAHDGPPRLLMIGHLRGIGTLSGLPLFRDEILPRLAAELGPDGFEVHLVGDHDPPDEFAEALRHPAVRLRGRIDEPDDEFLSADVLLAPNPTTTGASARILSGLTFANCIVAHTDSLVGIPELADGENSLLGADGPSLADATVRALRDPDLRERLGVEARALYERAFRPEVAAARLVQEVERLARTG